MILLLNNLGKFNLNQIICTNPVSKPADRGMSRVIAMTHRRWGMSRVIAMTTRRWVMCRGIFFHWQGAYFGTRKKKHWKPLSYDFYLGSLSIVIYVRDTFMLHPYWSIHVFQHRSYGQTLGDTSIVQQTSATRKSPKKSRRLSNWRMHKVSKKN